MGFVYYWERNRLTQAFAGHSHYSRCTIKYDSAATKNTKRWACPETIDIYMLPHDSDRNRTIFMNHLTNACGYKVLGGATRVAGLPRARHLADASVRGPGIAFGASRRPHPRRSNVMPAPDTIVLVHGFWVTPRSWENWITHYEAKGFSVLAPAYPGFEVEVEALNADPSPIADAAGAGDPRRTRRSSTRSTSRRSSSATRPAARSRSSCSTAASAPPASR